LAAAPALDLHALPAVRLPADGAHEDHAALPTRRAAELIAGDRVEADAGGRQRGVDAVGTVGAGGVGIAGVIEGGDAGLDLAVGGQHAAGYRSEERRVGGVGGGGVAAATDSDGHAVTGLDVAADGTAEGDAARRFGGVEQVVGGGRVEAAAGGRRGGVDAVGTVGAGGVGIAGVIEGGDAGLDLAVGGQHAAGY